MAGTRYDHPNCLVRREASFLTVAGANTVGGKFAVFQKMKLKQVHAIVVTAGSSATTGNQLIVKVGTTSVGAVVLGTSTAGSVVRSGALNVTVPADTLLSLTNGTDATGVAYGIYEYEVLPDAEFTA